MMTIYSVSGEKVRSPSNLPEVNGYIDWDGTNDSNVPIATGIYIFVIKNGQTVLLSGKILLVRN